MPRLSARAAFVVLSAILLSACGGPEAPEPVAPPAAETPAAESDHADHAAHAADEPHDHEGDEAAGGTAHVHGAADLAITLDGNNLMAELIAPMANFGLAESDDAYSDDVMTLLPRLIELEGGDCKASVPHPMTDKSGDHTDAIVHYLWVCAQPDDLRSVRFTGFLDFPGFETVSTIFITPSQQVADDLTPAKPEMSLR